MKENNIIKQNGKNIFILPFCWQDDASIKKALYDMGVNEFIDFDLGVSIKIIESCFELLTLQNEKLSNPKSSNLPLIIMKNDYPNFHFLHKVSKVLSPLDILVELTKNENTYLYYLTTNNDTSFVNNLCYLSINDLKEFIPSINNFSYQYELNNIIPTYLDIIGSKNRIQLYKEAEDIYIIDCEKYKFKILLVNDFTKLDEIEVDNYDLIIESTNFDISKSVINNQSLVNLYAHKIKQLGVLFRKVN